MPLGITDATWPKSPKEDLLKGQIPTCWPYLIRDDLKRKELEFFKVVRG
jgi:hypothetical protein